MTEVVTEIVPIPFIFLLIVYSYRKYSNVLNNKRSISSFSVHLLSIFHIFQNIFLAGQKKMTETFCAVNNNAISRKNRSRHQ